MIRSFDQSLKDALHEEQKRRGAQGVKVYEELAVRWNDEHEELVSGSGARAWFEAGERKGFPKYFTKDHFADLVEIVAVMTGGAREFQAYLGHLGGSVELAPVAVASIESEVADTVTAAAALISDTLRALVDGELSSDERRRLNDDLDRLQREIDEARLALARGA